MVKKRKITKATKKRVTKKKATKKKAATKRTDSAATKRTDPTDPEILSPEQAAAALGFSPRVVLEMARAGELPGKLIRLSWRFRRSTILKWLDEPAVPNLDDPAELLKALKDPKVKVRAGKGRR